MPRSAFVFVHSPLVGPSTWEPVADRFNAQRLLTSVPDLAGIAKAPVPRWPHAVVAVQQAVEALDTNEVVLLGHSGAGPLLPAIGEGLDVPVTAYVFIDAGLPAPGTATPLAPPQFLEFLTDLAVEGVLPPWSQWWPLGAMKTLLPDEVVRRRIEAELPRLPLSYFKEEVPAVQGWSDARGVYLQLSAPYEDDAARAEARGWPTERLDAGHLHAVVDAEDVTARIQRLLSLAGVRASPP